MSLNQPHQEISQEAGTQQSAPEMPIGNLPVSHSITGQQSSASVVSGAGPAVQNNPAPRIDPEKRKLIYQQLVLLLHAHKCQRRESESNGEVRQCTLIHCRTMKHVLSHMASCSVGKLCPVPHCSSSRQIISHWKNCTWCDCPVCIPLKQAFERQRADDQAGQRSPQNLNHIPTQQTAQNPQARVLTRPLQCGCAGAKANQSAQNVLVDNLQPKVKTENVGLINAPPTVPGALPNIPTVVKDWHNSVTQDLRQHLIGKIVRVFCPPDVATLPDSRKIQLITCCEKIEESIYNAANSKENYYELLAEKIFYMQQEIKEIVQKSRESQMQRQAVGHPNLAPMNGSNAATRPSMRF